MNRSPIFKETEMQTTTPNHTPWRYYDGAESLSERRRKSTAFDEFMERDSLKRRHINPIFWVVVGAALYVATIAAGWLLGLWLAR